MKKKLLPNYLLLCIVGVLIFSLSEYIQWYGDSYSYRFSFDTFEPIRNFSDIIPSQYAHYFHMNGRIWVHVLAQAFSALWGQTTFALCNALMYILFVLLFAKITGNSWRHFTGLLLCVLAILFFCDTSYNANCQIGYIWSATVTLAFIIEYFRTGRSDGMVRLAVLFLLSLLAGNGNEAISIGTGTALIVDFFRNFKRLTPKHLVMIAGFGIGGLLCCLAPGILSRASHTSSVPIWSIYRLIIYSRMLYVLIFTIAVLKLCHKLELKKFVRDNSFFIVAMLSLLIFDLVTGIGKNNRQLFGIELFSAILTVRALKDTALPRWILAAASIAVIGIYILKFEHLRISNADLRALRKELTNLDGRTVFMDFHHYPTFVHPTEMDNSILLYYGAVFAILDDMLDFGHGYHDTKREAEPFYKGFQIFPTAVKEAMESDKKDLAVKSIDGNYVVMTSKKNPATFRMERDYDIFGLKVPKGPYEFRIEDLEKFDSIGSRIIFYEDFQSPFVSNGDIYIRE